MLKSFRRSLPVGLAQAALCLGCLQPCTAQPAAAGLGERPRIGLVLSGGGARGGAHLGVLKVLQELQVPVDVVVGTSAGAIIGAAYASGMPLAEIEAEMRPLHTATLFRDIDRSDLPVRRKADDVHNYIGPEVGINAAGLALPKGAVAGVSLEAVLRRLTARQHDEDFDRLPVRFRAVATDVTTAEMVVLGRGSLATAIRASMALPAIVNPVEVDGRLLVDGGVSRNLPVDVARALGADVVIAVNIGTPLLRRDELTSLLSVSEQMVRVLTAKNVNQSLQELGPQDVLITPDLGGVTTADFDHLFEAASAGEKAARAAAGQLARWRVDASAYAALELRRITGPGAAPRVDEVRIVGLQRANPDAVRAALSIQPGDAFDAAAADADMRRLYASGDFERVSYHLGDSPAGGQVVTVDLSEKAWGPNYLRFGLELSSVRRQLALQPAARASPRLAEPAGCRMAQHAPDRPRRPPAHRVAPAARSVAPAVRHHACRGGPRALRPVCRWRAHRPLQARAGHARPGRRLGHGPCGRTARQPAAGARQAGQRHRLHSGPCAGGAGQPGRCEHPAAAGHAGQPALPA
ncbi:patatin-like phospholipase family protein [Methylibium rhizosphaerae]|uniref:patatin-like phospholipase family protein n=1 Tax=Methylibium rhizosphaerae TaxID=2570323 RepID=UPI0011286E27|nr:patatin-like phospholipase family protein [Methylibium rhizosphaerae]